MGTLQLSVSVPAPHRVEWQGQFLELGELLGEGSFSSVYVLKRAPHRNDQHDDVEDIVAKVISVADPSAQQMAERERSILQGVHHAHIVRLVGSVSLRFEGYQVLLLERLAGGELFDRIQSMGAHIHVNYIHASR